MLRRELTERLVANGARFRRMPLASRIALSFVLLIGLLALFAPWLAPIDPLQTGPPAQPPSADHWMGTDRTGRDILSRLLHGGRYSLLIGLGATSAAVLVGGLLGAIAATSRKVIDEAIMRALDVVMAFPGIALAAVFVAAFGRSLPVLVFTLAFLYTPQLARVVRANVLGQYGEDYVIAEEVLGARRSHILRKHVVRNCAAPVLVFATIIVADAIVLEASLSFIGAGIRDPLPSWGNVIAYGRNLVLSGGWWATFFPGMAILLTVLSLNVVSEGISDAWAALEGGPDDDDDDAPSEDDASVADQATPDLSSLVIPGADSRRRFGETVLEVSDLRIRFPGRHGDRDVVDGVSFTARQGEVVGVVGESGCGKSLTSLAVMGLLPPAAVASGSIRFTGNELLHASRAERRRFLGPGMAMIYQDALSSLNPAMKVEAQLKQVTRRGADRSPTELLELVGLDPSRTSRSYPHELSGGQRQRVLIAMALSRQPRLLVADEPTTALDVTIQSQIVALLQELREQLGFTLVIISHDLALVGQLADRIVVMYGGQAVEIGTTFDVLTAPRHRYTHGLLSSVVSVEARQERLHQIPGTVPQPANFPPGCRFADRCPAATALCRTVAPMDGDQLHHAAACHHPASPARAVEVHT
jgi:peptide/nickel transport system permease protein